VYRGNFIFYKPSSTDASLSGPERRSIKRRSGIKEKDKNGEEKGEESEE
jgi:hypothetical protein